jgi:hypothetical protein
VENVGHKKIHRFSLEGQIYDEKHIPRLKDQYQQIVTIYMENKGYIPQLDLDPAFSVEYDGKHFNFKLTIHGIYIGKAKARCYQAAYGSKLIERSFYQKNKHTESLSNVE